MRKLFGLATLLIAFFLVACEADPAFVGSGPTPTPLPGGGGGTSVAPAMGSGTGGSYQDGVISLSASNLQAGGSASLTVDFVDTNNSDSRIVGQDITVSFSSGCTPLLANIVEETITTTSGTATATYSATGCSGNDTITATAVVDDVPLTATAQVTVAAATVGSIQFVSAAPDNIGLLGTGGVGRQETSTVRFAVTDSTGGPVSGATVDFSLNTTIGGIQMTPTTATSDALGEVQTVVSAGSVATSVRVTATVVPSSPVIAAQSDQLTITTGIPDNDSVSLSMGCVNIEGWNLDGTTTDVTVRMSDRYNNPVPDNTAVTLHAEGGQIGGSCLTTTTPADGAGVCSVTFVSQNPRPADGRISILATAIGEESFIDNDADGFFNNTDVPIEIGEPYRDDNESGTYNLGEVFSDFNSNGLRDDATHADYVNFNGLLCDSMTALCSPNETLFVSDTGVVVVSGSGAVFSHLPAGVLDITGGTASVTVTIGDVNNQPMAGGTTIEAEASNGTLVGPDSYTVSCSTNNGPLDYVFTVEPDTTPSTSPLTITVTSPSGIISIYNISVMD
jgi:hypothetical protein